MKTRLLLALPLLLLPLAFLGTRSGTLPDAVHALVPTVRTSTGADLPRSLDTWRGLYAEQGQLTREETERLKERRTLAAEALQASVGAGGPAAVDWAIAALRDAKGSRERLLLIGALGRNPSEEAVAALESAYAEQDSFRLQEEALRALGTSAGDGATDVLLDALDAAEDERLRQIAAQSLTGHVEALAPLTALASDPTESMNVRLEAIPAIGAMGTPESRAALEQIAADDGLEARVRQFAARELART